MNRGILCVIFENCQMHGSRLSVSSRILVSNFEYHGSQKLSVIIVDMTAVVFWKHFGTFALWLLCAGCSTFPPLTSKLCWLYSVSLVSIYSVLTYHSYIPFSSSFFVYYYSLSSIFASLISVFAAYVASSWYMLRHHCFHFYQDGAFVLDLSSRLRPICSVFMVVFVLRLLCVFVFDTFTKLFAWCLLYRISIEEIFAKILPCKWCVFEKP